MLVIEQDTLFEPEAHVHVYEVWQGPHRTCPPITTASSRWCWTCASWVMPLRNEGEYTRDEQFKMKRNLYIAIRKGKTTKTNAIKQYAEAFEISQYESAREIDWTIGYYNEHGLS